MLSNQDVLTLERQAADIISAMTGQDADRSFQRLADLLIRMARELDDLKARQKVVADACQDAMGA